MNIYIYKLFYNKKKLITVPNLLYSYTTATSALPDINAQALGLLGLKASAFIQAEHECTLYNCYVPLT